MGKLLVICGPTATGKTALGIRLAKKFNGEIVSADSRQVYKEMDIGIGKDIPKSSKLKSQTSKLNLKTKNYLVGYRLLNNIPIWLVDICNPDQEFSVAHFVKFATIVIKDIWVRKKLPIVVGGTGFWINALIKGVESIGIPPDWKLRKQLSNEAIEQLRDRLKKLDYQRWERMNQSDRNNSRRLIRAIEIAKQIKNEKLKIKNGLFLRNGNSKLKINKLLMIGLKTKDYRSLYTRIDRRVEKRIKQGAEREVKSLLQKGYPFDLPSFSATGYRVWKDYFDCKTIAGGASNAPDTFDSGEGRTPRPERGGRHFEGKKTLTETIKRWKYDEHGLARRQLTFFKKLKGIRWFYIEDTDYLGQIENLVRDWYINKQL